MFFVHSLFVNILNKMLCLYYIKIWCSTHNGDETRGVTIWTV